MDEDKGEGRGSKDKCCQMIREVVEA